MEILINKTDGTVTEKKESKKILKTRGKKFRDRRKKLRDRRQSVNEGLLVHLSTRNDRRESRDRRALKVPFPIEVAKAGSNNQQRLFCTVV